jgi:hypothetical protein
MTPAKSATKPEIEISELGRIIDRENNTIRKWEREGILPKHLHPKRGKRNVRVWTHAQVHGPKGILAWMKKNNMRPGNAIASEQNQGAHLRHLRRPKFITADLVHLAVLMKDDGKSPDEIIKTLFPRTKYVSEKNFEDALRRHFRAQGIEFFPPRNKGKNPSK